jgi:hypothetical protein
MLEPHGCGLELCCSNHIVYMFLCFMFYVFLDEWLGAMSPTDEVDATMELNHHMYVFVMNRHQTS